jgi:pyrimidine-specific ribonucleoside hydrolase
MMESAEILFRLFMGIVFAIGGVMMVREILTRTVVTQWYGIMNKMVFEMETGDPDDFLTLLRLLDHPKVDLKAVVINPGGPKQVGLVRWALREFKRTDVLVGSLDLHNKNKRTKPDVSEWHNIIFDQFGAKESFESEEGWHVLEKSLDLDTTMFIGAPPRNLGKLLSMRQSATKIGRVVVQGGFAGDSIVPPEHRLPKFEGMETCRTFNLCGHKASSGRLMMHNSPKQFVSKNVCHGILYDQEFHNRLKDKKAMVLSLELIYGLMKKTYMKEGKVKALHDPFAMCCAIDESIATWKKVSLYTKDGKWGSRTPPTKGTNERITITGDKDKFFEVFTQ